MTTATLLTAYKAAKYRNALKALKTKRQTLVEELNAQKDTDKLVHLIEDTLLNNKEHGQGFTWIQHDFLFFQTKGSRLRIELEKAKKEINKTENFTLVDVLLAAEQDSQSNDACTAEQYLERAKEAENESFNQLSTYYYIKHIETVLEQDNTAFTAEIFNNLRNTYDQIEQKLKSDSYLTSILKYRIDEKHAECLFDRIKKETEQDKYNLNDIIGKSNTYIKKLNEQTDPLNLPKTETIDLGNTKQIFTELVSTYIRFAVTNPLYNDLPKAANPFLWKKYTYCEKLSRSTKDGGQGPFLESRDPDSFLAQYPYSKPATNSFIPEPIKSSEQQLHHIFYSFKQDCSIAEPKPFDLIKDQLDSNNDKTKKFLSRIYFWLSNIFSLHTDNEVKACLSNWIKENHSGSKFPSILELAQEQKIKTEETARSTSENIDQDQNLSASTNLKQTTVQKITPYTIPTICRL